ncbi:aminopeptidase P family protein [Algoriphagus sediminis]|uniref:Xaa-Pro aminopeptidase n=1 Tax=Algoriphagus sediminis TaxID=3057113 RepID=A0ABT7YH52_9BACT|nr:aminopeptidase P family protein [Algoriphagus sediminis]MDN3205840.1 aminopeptidase P N-terminal domain-containing protein [Algoriphagus sediminis]
MKKFIIALSLLLISSFGFAQSYFEDGLSPEWHEARRQALRERMAPNTMAIFFNNSVKNRTNDVDYVYHPDTDFFYMTGFREPNSVLIIFSEERDFGDFKADEIIYVQNRDPRAEMWNGKRLGVEGVKEILGFEHVFINDEFGKTPELKTEDFDKFFSMDLSNGVAGSRSNLALRRMLSQYKDLSGYPEEISPASLQAYELIRSTDIENSANVAQILGRMKQRFPDIEEDELINDYLSATTPEERIKVKESIPETKADVQTLSQVMDVLREVKTEEEIELLAKAVKISAIGQIEVMKAAKEGMSEREIQGIHEFIWKRYGSEEIGYPSIVGAGHNGCILHYVENDMPSIDNRLVLMDLGAEWRGYTADVTRTIPISGKFNEEEKAIYDLVFKSQEAGIALCKAGVEFGEIGRVTRQIINEGLVELGIIKPGERHNYFPHGTSHHLGLDVHDRGGYGALKPGVVLTVEPGIYIPEGSDCDPKWWNIAVRIEDDILVTDSEPVNLSADAPRTTEAIEELMKQPSVLDNWTLPEIN